MSSLALPRESRCKQLVYQMLTKQNKQECQTCFGRIAWKKGREYGWCKICRKKIRPKAHTWFRGSKLSYQQIFLLLHYWQQRQSPGSAKLATGLSYTTVRRWYWRFRALVPKEVSDKTDPGTMLSGVVEVDESWFGKRKFGGQTIVIGAIERDTKRLKLQVIPDTEQDTLEAFLELHVDRSSLVVTDCGSGYNGLSWLGFGHETWNHSKGNFAGTNHIESTWSAMKRHLRKLYGCVPTKHIQLILNEWMARHNRQSLFTSPTNYLNATLFRIG